MHPLENSDDTRNGFAPSPISLPERKIVPATYSEVPPNGSVDFLPELESGGLLEYWRILRRRQNSVIALAAVGAVIGYLASLPRTPIYRASTSLEILSLNENFLNMKGSNPFADNSSSADSTDIDTQIKLLQSDSLLERVAKKLRAKGLPEAEPTRIDEWLKLLNLPNLHGADPREAALLFAAKTVQARSAGSTRIIELTVDSPSAKTAADFANTLASEFIDQSLETRWKTTQHTGEWLSHEVDDMRIQLEKAEGRLQQYANHAGLMFTDNDKRNVSEDRLSQLEAALTAAQTERILKQSRWETANSSPPDALPDILNDPTLHEYQDKLTDLKRQLAEQRATYKDTYKTNRRILAQIEPLQAALDAARVDVLKRIHDEYDEAVRKEKLLASDYAAQRTVVTGEDGRSVQYGILKREVESNQQLYEAMLQQLQQSSLASALRASNMHVVDRAKVPTQPYKPDRRLSTAMGLLAGLFIGAAFVVLREHADGSVQEPGESQFFLNLPELGVIPTADTGVRVRVRLTDSKRPNTERLNGTGSRPVTSRLTHGRVELVSWQRKTSVMAESFRATLVSILFSGESGSRPGVLVFTSAGPAEGKSTVVSNLGIAIAELNQRTLLIDADLRKPRLHDIFTLSNDRGLSDLLRSKEPVSTFLKNGIIQQTGIPDLFVLTSGTTTLATTGLLYSSRMPELLQELRTEFQSVLIDTPPMLQIPDARVLGRLVDRIVLVMRAGKTTRAAAAAARQRFSEDGTKVLGTILNDWNPKRAANGYYGTYHGYSYGVYGHPYNDGSDGHQKPQDEKVLLKPSLED